MIFFILLLIPYVIRSENPHLNRECSKWCHYGNESMTPSKYSSQSGQYPTVDVMLWVTGNFETKYKYISRGDWWINPLLLLTSSRNDCRIHLITDDDRILVIGRRIGPPLYVTHVSHFDDKISDFKMIYKHFSVNPVDYESLCFYRWIVYDSLVREWNSNHVSQQISRIISIDLDAMLLRRGAKLFDDILALVSPDTYDDYFVILKSGSIQFFNIQGLQKYSKFVYDWYNQSREQVRNNTVNIAKVGKLYGQLHISDMQLAKTYQDLQNISYNRFIFAAHLNKTLQTCIYNSIGCIPFTHHFELTHLSLVNDSLYGPNGFPLCAIVRAFDLLTIIRRIYTN